MKYLSTCLFALILTPSLALAQNMSMADFEQAVKNDVKKEFAKSMEANTVLYDIKDTTYYARFSEKGKYVLIFGRAPAAKFSLEKVNGWNRKAVFTRAYLDGEEIVLEMAISTVAASGAIIKASFDNFERELVEFEKLLK